jgi:hypothetical protein
MKTSRYWLEYFRSNQDEPEIPWEQAVPPPARLRAVLSASLPHFQLGESGTGTDFLARAREHARQNGDRDFPEALALFIAEEQRHSRLLARYLHLLRIPLLRHDPIAFLFRRLRKVAGLEGMVTVLVAAEIVAIPYYRSVLRLSSCPALRAICRRILREESRHLLFQASTLGALQSHRSPSALLLTHLIHRVLLAGACLTAWLRHALVLPPFVEFWRECQKHLGTVERVASRTSLIGAAGIRADATGAV